MSESPGIRLGRMMVTEPELTQEQPDDFLSRFTAWITADGSDCGAMATRLERLKFETIVREKSYREVLAELDGSRE